MPNLTRSAVVTSLAAIAILGSLVLSHAADAPDCTAAASEASVQANLPAGLLHAIGIVESGRRSSAGVLEPWPYAVNANGAAHWFTNEADATSYVRDALTAGARAVDVGCFQIDLQDHPYAFASLDAAFDPATNAGVAARFLTSLHERLGSWPAAIASYHSAHPQRGLPYARLVLAAWHGGGSRRPRGTDPYLIHIGPVVASLPRIITP